MSAKHITTANLAALVEDLLHAGTQVAGPAHPRHSGPQPATTDGPLDYRWLSDAGELVLGAGVLPRRSIKEFFLPPTEELLRYRQTKAEVTLQEAPTSYGPRLILGAHPCDVAALEIVDRVMGWDYKDEPWFGRRAATTVVSLACPGVDRSCFCTAVGLAPDAARAADAMLVPVAGGYRVELLTDKGEALVARHADRFAEATPVQQAEADRYRSEARAKVAGNLALQPAAVRAWLEANFEHPYWNTLALRCHGCGACAAVCPTCHCFDIVDEPSRLGCGARRRNWDTCQTAVFTLHGSGHNPRAQQSARYRQRVMHKFAIYPKKFSEVLCTGCGRCSRACPGGMDLLDILTDIGKLAAGSASVTGAR